ncbi:MAG: biotin--[acetyl-CoA-carboxylase] ligase [Cohaesibacter sp.]|jgi:BirA family biotin operon repressor/biotin-[acetyl-CoA-carboxylase] ligase|nr:biotin--[acetyl-CoA-carboxylase] ligase [Cohaesibacter sp.]
MVPHNYRHQAHEAVTSTNELALDAGRAGDAGNLWITAKEQTTGRGRRGRAWVSKSGNLYASLLLVNPAPQSDVSQLPLVIATAAHRAVSDSLAPDMRAQVSIKWPNDLLMGDQKISGILLEGSNRGEGDQIVVIGIGINCRTHPDKTDGLAAANLSQSGFDIDPDILFPMLAQAVDRQLQIWNRGKGFADIREDWLIRARGVGQPIVVRLPNEELTGIFDRLDNDGALVLLMDDGQRRTILAGDVFWPAS